MELTSTRGGGIITGGGKKAPTDPEAEGDTDEELARRSSIALPPQLSSKQRPDFLFLAFTIFLFAAATCTEGDLRVHLHRRLVVAIRRTSLIFEREFR